jgi:hypothetical protein
MMQMISNGGLNPLVDGKREADISNPKGYFEYEPVMSINKDNTWLHLAQNKVVKIVGPLLNHLDPKYRYKVIFMTRDLHEIIKSQRVMSGKDADVLPIKLYNSYINFLEKVGEWKEDEPGVEIIYVDYKDVLENPDESIDKINKFIGKKLDTKAMKSCIDKSLHRNKVES